jgi:hypothetical protein
MQKLHLKCRICRPVLATGRNPEDDVARSPEMRLSEVAVAWPCRSLNSLVQEGKSHGGREPQLWP